MILETDTVGRFVETYLNVGQLILSVLATAQGPMTKKKLFRLLRGKSQIKLLALRNLISSGKIIKTGVGIKGKAFLYSLASTETAISDDVVEFTI